MKQLLSIAMLATVLLAASATPARADVPPPNKQQCDSLKEGDACVTDDKKDGACVKDMCSHLDYSDGSPPGTVTEPCLLCKEGATVTNDSGGCAMGRGAPGASAWWAAAALLLVARRRRG
jgi:hypothetical protein